MAAPTVHHNGAGTHDAWLEHTRVFLQPIAAPSILGLFGFAASTFIVAANLAGWYGGTDSARYLFPFTTAFGGVAQLAAAMWAFRARDAVASAMHGAWGSFWIGFGILNLLAATGDLTLPTGQFVEFGYWFLALAVITGFGTLAAAAENFGLTAVLGVLTVGAAFAAVFYLTGNDGWKTAAGWVLIAAAVLAAYTAGGMMIAASWGRRVLPIGDHRRRAMDALQYELGEPGVRQGQ